MQNNIRSSARRDQLRAKFFRQASIVTSDACLAGLRPVGPVPAGFGALMWTGFRVTL
jgi:hypothetical protein